MSSLRKFQTRILINAGVWIISVWSYPGEVPIREHKFLIFGMENSLLTAHAYRKKIYIIQYTLLLLLVV